MQKVVESLSKSKMTTQKSPSCNASPVLMKYLGSSSSWSLNSSLNSRSSMDMSPFSPVLMSKLSCNSTNKGPMSAVDEEDVLVMDGLPITRYSPSPSSSSKTELYRSWDELGMYSFGTKYQSAHGKEGLRPNCFPTIKNKSEAQICKSFITGSCVYGSKCRFIHQIMTDSALVLTIPMEDHPKKASASKTPISPITFKSQAKTNNTSVKPVQTTSKTITLLTKPAVQNCATFTTRKECWSPEDDDIEVTLPSDTSKTSPREKIDEYIDSILYRPSTAASGRLPVFAEIFFGN